jgi:hypothetical protein
VTTTTATTEPVAVEPLPDGRALHIHADGSIVVVGEAQAREHPVPGVDWIRRTPPRPRARRSPRTGAARTGAIHTRTVDPTTIDRGVWALNRRTAHDRATALLLSLLDDVQREEYERTKHFWVEVPQGRLRFGRLYSIRFEPRGTNTVRLLCVVPTRHHELPAPDIWANLLLAVRDDPARFFAVAVDRTAELAMPPR